MKDIELVKLNRGGKIIGKIVNHKGKFYYYSPRTPEMYFIKFQGFGLDKALFKSFMTTKFQTDLNKRLGKETRIEGIIIHYKGKKNILYFASMDAWLLGGIPYGTAKIKNNDTETYGEQLILPVKFMEVMK